MNFDLNKFSFRNFKKLSEICFCKNSIFLPYILIRFLTLRNLSCIPSWRIFKIFEWPEFFITSSQPCGNMCPTPTCTKWRLWIKLEKNWPVIARIAKIKKSIFNSHARAGTLWRSKTVKSITWKTVWTNRENIFHYYA